MWSTNVFQTADAYYRANNVVIPGTVWPTAAVGMNQNLQQFRAIERSGITYWEVLPNGHIKWMWSGRQ